MKILALLFMFASAPAMAQMESVDVLPFSQSTSAYSSAKVYVSSVAVSSWTITRVDSEFDTIMKSTTTGLGNWYIRTEIEVQNNESAAKYCGYSATGLTTSNSFKIGENQSRVFKVGKGIPIYCLNGTTSSGVAIVGGMAYK